MGLLVGLVLIYALAKITRYAIGGRIKERRVTRYDPESGESRVELIVEERFSRAEQWMARVFLVCMAVLVAELLRELHFWKAPIWWANWWS